MQQLAQATKAGLRSAVPKLPLGGSKFSHWKGAQIGAISPRSQTTRGLQGVLKAHCDMPPIEDKVAFGMIWRCSFHSPASPSDNTVAEVPSRTPALTKASANSISELPLRANANRC